MNRYTGTAKRIIAAISCAAMVLSNMGSDIATITAYADEPAISTETTSIVQNPTDTDVAPETEGGETKSVGEGAGSGESGSNDEDAGSDNSGTGDEGAGTGNSGTGDEGAGTGNSGTGDEGAGSDNSGTGDEGAGTGNSGTGDEGAGTGNSGTGDEGAGTGNSGTGDEGAGNGGSTEQTDECTCKAKCTDEHKDAECKVCAEDITKCAGKETEEKEDDKTPTEEPQEKETVEVDDTEGVTFTVHYLEGSIDEETEQYAAEAMDHDATTLTIDKDNVPFTFEDNAEAIADYYFDYAYLGTIDDEDLFANGIESIDIHEDVKTEETDGKTIETTTRYYTIDGEKVEKGSSVDISYIYVSLLNDAEVLTANYKLTVNYNVGSTTHSDIFDTDGGPWIEFQKDGETTWTKLTDANKAEIGLETIPELSATSAVRQDTYTVQLPEKTSDNKTLSYRIGGQLKSNYKGEYAALDTSAHTQAWNIEETNSQSVTIKWLDGANSYGTRSTDDVLKTYGTLKLDSGTITVDGKETDSITVGNSDATALGYYETLYFDADGNQIIKGDTTSACGGNISKATEWVLTFPNLPKYSDDGAALKYYFDQGEKSEFDVAKSSEAGLQQNNITDYKYTLSIENRDETSTTRLYLGETQKDQDGKVQADQSKGGEARFTLTGKTHFEATKKWIDDGATERPAATFDLWRYADGGDYTVASAVDGYAGVAGPQNEQNEQTDGNVLIGGTKADNTYTNALDAFNPDGTRYVYIARESVGGTYETKYWDTEKGQYESVPGNYVDNGKTFYNVNTETTSQYFSKTFDAKAVLDLKYNVKIYLWQTTDEYVYENKLTKPVTADESTDGQAHAAATQVQDENGENKVVELKGFSEKNVYATGSFDGLPSYNTTVSPENANAGEKLYYFATEGTVTRVDEYGNPIKDESGKAITAEPEVGQDGNTYIVIDGYRYKQSIQDTADTDEEGGNITRQSIVNTLVSNAEITIAKTFPDGLPRDTDEWKYSEKGETIYYEVTRENEVIGYYSEHYEGTYGDPFSKSSTITSYNDLYPTLADAKAGTHKGEVYDEKTQTYSPRTGSTTFERYKNDGSEYMYAATEPELDEDASASGFNYVVEGRATNTDATYDSDAADGSHKKGEHYLKFNQSLDNRVNRISGVAVYITKDWKDDSQQLYRGNIRVALQIKLTTQSDWVTLETGEITSAETGKPLTVADNYTGKLTYKDANGTEHTLNGLSGMATLIDKWNHNGYSQTPEDGEFTSEEKDVGEVYICGLKETDAGHQHTDKCKSKTATTKWSYSGTPAFRVIEYAFEPEAGNTTLGTTSATGTDGKTHNYYYSDVISNGAVVTNGNGDLPSGNKTYTDEHKTSINTTVAGTSTTIPGGYLDTGDQNFDITYQYLGYNGTEHRQEGEEAVAVAITNTRVGVVSADFDKSWNDDNDELGQRPTKIELTVRATVGKDKATTTNVWYDADGNALNPATGDPLGTGVTVAGSDPKDRNAYLTGAETAASVKGYERVYELSPDQDGKWTLNTGELRKYDANGAVIYYTIVKETMYKDGKVVSSKENHYALNEGSYEDPTWNTIPTNHTGDTGNYNIVNTLTEKVTIQFNKIWRDAGEANSSRPDIYPVVYRGVQISKATYDGANADARKAMGTITVNGKTIYYKNVEKVKDYINVDKMEKAKNGGTSVDNWWQFELAAQDRYDGSGAEYIYFVGEDTTVKDSDYKLIGAYVETPGTTDSDFTTKDGVTSSNFNPEKSSYTAFGAITLIDGTTVSGLIPIVEESTTQDSQTKEWKTTYTTGTLVNKPEKERDVSGRKVWSTDTYNLPDDQKPSIKVTLYRLPYDVAQAFAAKHATTTGKGTDHADWSHVFDATYKFNAEGADQETYTSDGETKTIYQWLQAGKVTSSDYDQDATTKALTPKSSTTGTAPFGDAEQTLSYTDGWDYSWTNVKKYDDNGKPYTYLVREELATTMEVGGDGYKEMQEYYDLKVIDGNNSVKAENSFTPDGNVSITFTKDWEIQDFDDIQNARPEIKVTLVRYLTDKDGKIIASSRDVVEEGTNSAYKKVTMTSTPGYDGTISLNADSCTATITFKGDLQTSQSKTQQDKVTWSNLPKIGPNLRPYVYYVEEQATGTSLAGMKVSTQNEETEKTSATAGLDYFKTTTAKSYVQVLQTAGTGEDAGKYTGTAEMHNYYGKVRGGIKVQKVWEDSKTTSNDNVKYPGLGYLATSLTANSQTSYVVDPTLTDVELKIKLSREWTPKGGQKQTEDITIETTDGLNNSTSLKATDWFGYINDIDQYSAQGDEYNYVLGEDTTGLTFDLLKFYNSTTQTAHAKQKTVTDLSTESWAQFDQTITDNKNIAKLTNTPKTEKVSAEKDWWTQRVDKDGNWVTPTTTDDTINKDPDLKAMDALGALPDSITYTVQYRIATTVVAFDQDGKESTPTFSGAWNTVYTSYTSADDNAPYTITGTKGTDGKYTYAVTSDVTLPSYVYTQTAADGKTTPTAAYAVEYRAIETSMTWKDGDKDAGGNTIDKVVKVQDRIADSNTTDDQTHKTYSGASYKIGSMKGSDATEVNSNKTVTTNTIPIRTMTVRKIWDDEQNRDQQRPTTLTFEIGVQNGKAAQKVSKTLEKKDAVAALPANDGTNNADNDAWKNYYEQYLSYLAAGASTRTQTRAIDVSAVWEWKVDLPTTVGDYVVKEAQYNDGSDHADFATLRTNKGYTTYVYDYTKTTVAEKWAVSTDANPSENITTTATNFAATFANAKAMYKQTIDPQKKMSGSVGGTWSSTVITAEGADKGKVEITIPETAKGYIETLKGDTSNKLAFRLRYKLGSGQWQDFTAETKNGKYVVTDQTLRNQFGLGENDILEPIHTVTFGNYGTADASGNVKFTTAVADWTNLPLYIYNADGNASSQITYMIEEGYYNTTTNAFVAIGNATTIQSGNIQNYWDTTDKAVKPDPESVTKSKSDAAASKDNQTLSSEVTITNVPKGKSVTGQKQWKTWEITEVNTDGSIKSKATKASDPITDIDLLKKLNAYGALPQSIEYTVQYREKGSSTDWVNYVPAGESNAKVIYGTLDVANNKFNYQTDALSNLPAFAAFTDADQNVTYKEVEYRAIESSMAFDANKTQTASVISTDDIKTKQNDDQYTLTNGMTVSANNAQGSTAATYTTTSTNIIYVRTLTLQKIWDDEENRDGYRTNVGFTFKRDDVASTNTAKLTKDNALKTSSTERDFPSNTAFTKYVSEELNKATNANRSLGKYAVWTGTVENVPYYKNVAVNGAAAASEYEITEAQDGNTGDFTKYTHKVYDAAQANAADTWHKQTDCKIQIKTNESEFIATYANVHNMDTFTIDPIKLFTLTTGVDTTKWESVEKTDGTVEVTIPATGVSAIKAMQGLDIYFKLTYAMPGDSAAMTTTKWSGGTATVNSSTTFPLTKNTDAWGVAGGDTWKVENGNYTAYQKITIKDLKANGDKYTFTVAMDNYTNLPVNWYLGNANQTGLQINYQVEEVFATKNDSTYYKYDATDLPDTIKAVLGDWSAPTVAYYNAEDEVITGTSVTGTVDTTIKAKVTNEPDTIKVIAQKSWATYKVTALNADGTVKTTELIKTLNPKNTTDTTVQTELERLDKYGLMPDKITYQVQYRAKSDTTGSWTNYKIGTSDVEIVGQKGGTTKYLYEATLADLPEFQEINGSNVAVTYRAVEESMTWDTTTKTVDDAATVLPTKQNVTDSSTAADKATNSYTIAGFTAHFNNTEKAATTEPKAPASYTTVNTNEIVLRDLVIEKLWDDGENRDGLRPEATQTAGLKTGIRNSSTAASADANQDVTVYTAVSALPTATDAGYTAYSKYVNSTTAGGEGLLGDRSMSKNSVWTETVAVPYYKATEKTAQTYTVTETTPTNYRARTYQTTTSKWSALDLEAASTTDVTTTNSIAATAADFSAVFANYRKVDGFTIQPIEKWSAAAWGTTTETQPDKDGVISTETTINTEAESYFTTLQTNKFAVQLQYSTDGGKNWITITGTDEQIKQLGLGKDDAIHEASFTVANGKVTTKVNPWTDLPLLWYNDTATGSTTTIQYRTQEGFKNSDGSFFSMEDAKTSGTDTQKALAEMWTVTTDETSADVKTTGITGTKDAVKKPTFTNSLVTANTQITKVWKEFGTGTNLRPATVQFYLEYSSNGGTNWSVVPASWIKDATIGTVTGTSVVSKGSTAADTESKSVGNVSTVLVGIAQGKTDEGAAAPTGDKFTTAVNGIYVDQLPQYTADGTAYKYRAREYNTGAYAVEYVDNATANITQAQNTLWTVSATVNKNWDDPFDFDKDDVSTTTFVLQRKEVTGPLPGATNAATGAAIDANDIMTLEDVLPDAGNTTDKWEEVPYSNLTGVQQQIGTAAQTAVDSSKGGNYSQTLNERDDAHVDNGDSSAGATLTLTNLRGIKSSSGDQATYYVYRFVEKDMLLAGGRDTGTTSASRFVGSQQLSNTELTADGGDDGGYNLYYGFGYLDKDAQALSLKADTDVASNITQIRTYTTHVNARIKSAKINVYKDWDDANNRHGKRPDALGINNTMSIATHGQLNKPQDINVASYTELRANATNATKDWKDIEKWQRVPVMDAKGDLITYTFTEVWSGDWTQYYTATKTPASFTLTTENLTSGTYAEVSFQNRDPWEPDNGGDTPTPKPTPTPEKVPVDVIPDPDPTPLNGDGALYDEFGNLIDEYGNLVDAGGAGGGTGDDSMMDIYGYTAALSLTILAAWFVLYRRKREDWLD